ncbi:MAG: hypothetical protein AAFR84_23700, partial [Pseudomonadota bacterium]
MRARELKEGFVVEAAPLDADLDDDATARSSSAAPGGAPPLGEGDGVEARDAFAEHVGWWAALFEVPCVARCSSLEDIDAVAPARPEFIELAWPSLASAAEAERHVRQM